MSYLCCVLFGYIVGCFNPSYFLAKIRGFDIREKGSGNAGASNALILFGKLRGVLCALIDIAKATLIILAMQKLFPTASFAFSVTGVACILGHIFPFYMKFRGGKGLACLGGMILAFDWRVFLIMLAIEIAVAVVGKYICFVPISASLVFPVVYGVMREDVIGALILYIAAVIIIFRHRENIARIMKGREMRFNYLWKRDAEIERLRKNMKDEAEREKELYKK